MIAHRIFVEKHISHAIEASRMLKELKTILQISSLQSLRYAVIYDVFGLDLEKLEFCASSVFFEPPRSMMYYTFDDMVNAYTVHKLDVGMENESCIRSADNLSIKNTGDPTAYCAMEFLPGQYDQRADAAEQCIALLGYENITITTGEVFLLYGNLSQENIIHINEYIINPIEMREKHLNLPPILSLHTEAKCETRTIDGFGLLSLDDLANFKVVHELSLSIEDLLCIQQYFKSENRSPSQTEIRILDTYWSDHCRHTTFLTELTEVDTPKGVWQRGFALYRSLREKLARTSSPMSLMDIATIGAKYLISEGYCDDIDVSEEINACSIKVKVSYYNGSDEDWLLMYKNETHNHPTEIEPFGGAATCLGGAIRDPLSGRAYVFAGMRMSGSADPREDIANTLTNKLPQRYITQEAAHGFSSYGNQVGLPTLYVQEIYHPQYKAKRLEAGFVMGAAPESVIRRSHPSAGDAILLVGGRTGRDGIGGAVGSSKKHTSASVKECFAEVQKGNPIEAHALQRLFRNSQVSTLIKRCNDFGAGGVSVAVGELADGVCINLDTIPVKYMGLDGTELAISESQERMAIVVSAKDMKRFVTLAESENIEATQIATVTNTPRMIMKWHEHTIADISRSFLNTHGASRKTKVVISKPNVDQSTIAEKESSITLVSNTSKSPLKILDLGTRVSKRVGLLELASQQGLQSMFDSSIGKGTVLMPYGGATQESPAEGAAALFPTTRPCLTTALASASCPIRLLKHSPFHGASYAVVNSLAKLVAMGGSYSKARLSFQEYFRSVEQNPVLWGNPTAALLGALEAQVALKVPAIGGKDSMSGNYEQLYVPPTFISFAVTCTDVSKVRSVELHPDFKNIYLMRHVPLEDNTPNYTQLTEIWNWVSNEPNIQSAVSIGEGGVFLGLLKMCVGNNMGVHVSMKLDLLYADFLYDTETEMLVNTLQGSLLIASNKALNIPKELNVIHIVKKGQREAMTTKNEQIVNNAPHISIEIEDYDVWLSWSLDSLRAAWKNPLANIFPITEHTTQAANLAFKQPRYLSNFDVSPFNTNPLNLDPIKQATHKRLSFPRVCIPVFPGTNSEYDTASAFEYFGARCNTPIFQNKNQQTINESIDALVNIIQNSQIFVIAGGFSLGDQPDGSGKYIANILRNFKIIDALSGLLERNGLMLGICNGFQALIKSSWLPYGTLQTQTEESPTLSNNAIGIHISRIARIKVCNNSSPWLSLWQKNQELLLPVSHGEGRFFASPTMLRKLETAQQIATVYASEQDNPNGSISHIEGITSKDGKIFGRMGHAERVTLGTFKNIPDYTSALDYSTHALFTSLAMFKAGVDWV